MKCDDDRLDRGHSRRPDPYRQQRTVNGDKMAVFNFRFLNPLARTIHQR